MEPQDFQVLASLVTKYDARLLVLELGRAMVETGGQLVEESENDADTQKARALVASGQNLRNLSTGVR